MKSVQRMAAEQRRPTSVRPAEPAAGERSAARPLPEGVRARMESAFGADFSHVTVQEDEGPAAQGVDALTRGETISLRPGLPGPESSQGLEIIGHELEHVLQQRSGRVPGTGLTEEPGLESEADEAGRRAAQGQPVTDAATNAAVSQDSGEAGAQAVAQPMRRSPAYQFSFPPMPASVAAEPGGFYFPQNTYNPPPAPAPAPVMPEATPIRQAEPPGTDVGSPYAYEDPDESIVPRNRRPTL